MSLENKRVHYSRKPTLHLVVTARGIGRNIVDIYISADLVIKASGSVELTPRTSADIPFECACRVDSNEAIPESRFYLINLTEFNVGAILTTW